MLASTSEAINNPHGVSVGALAAALAHVPRWPVRLQCINGSEQAVLQQTPLAQKPVAHCTGAVQLEPLGCRVGVTVGVAVGVLVAVCVGVEVGVLVASMSWPRISPPGKVEVWMFM